MKKLLFICFLFLSLGGGAYYWFIAHPGYAPKVNSYGNLYNRLIADSAQHIPNKSCLCTNDADTTPQLFIYMDTLRGFWNGTFKNIGFGSGGGSGTDTIYVYQIGTGSPQIPLLYAVNGALRSVRLVKGLFTTPVMNSDSAVHVDLDTTGSSGAAYKAWIVAQYGPGGGGFGTVNVSGSITGNGSSGTPIQLSGDASSPGVFKYYGTDILGNKGWNDFGPVAGLDPVLGYGDTAYQKDMILSWDSQSASFSAGFARRFLQAHPDSLFGVFDVGDVDGHGTALFMIMSQKSVGVRADSGFQIGSFGDTRFTQIRNQAALAGGGFVAKLYLPATGNPIDTVFTWSDFRNGGGGGGGGTTNGIGRDTVQTYTSGSTLTQSSSTNYIQLNPSSVQSTLTITTLASGGTWHTSNDLYIVAGGTVTSGNPVITTLSIAAGSGLTLVQAITPTTINAGEVIHYHKIGTLLYRIN